MRLIAIILILLSVFACRKVKYKDGHGSLPRKTETGRGIFACYIDDYTYITRRQEAVVYNSKTGYLYLENRSGSFQFRLFVYEGIFGPGNYAFDNTGEEMITNDYIDRYGVDGEGINQLEITKLDLEKNIVSGTFGLDLIAENGDKKTIRDGRFDLEIKVLY